MDSFLVILKDNTFYTRYRSQNFFNQQSPMIEWVILECKFFNEKIFRSPGNQFIFNSQPEQEQMMMIDVSVSNILTFKVLWKIAANLTLTNFKAFRYFIIFI